MRRRSGASRSHHRSADGIGEVHPLVQVEGERAARSMSATRWRGRGSQGRQAPKAPSTWNERSSRATEVGEGVRSSISLCWWCRWPQSTQAGSRPSARSRAMRLREGPRSIRSRSSVGTRRSDGVRSPAVRRPCQRGACLGWSRDGQALGRAAGAHGRAPASPRLRTSEPGVGVARDCQGRVPRLRGRQREQAVGAQRRAQYLLAPVRPAA